MRRLAIWASLCVFLLGSALARVQAQQISIAGDVNSPEMTMDISLRDADLNEVLTAMFNTTGGKYRTPGGQWRGRTSSTLAAHPNAVRQSPRCHFRHGIQLYAPTNRQWQLPVYYQRAQLDECAGYRRISAHTGAAHCCRVDGEPRRGEQQPGQPSVHQYGQCEQYEHYGNSPVGIDHHARKKGCQAG